MDFSQYGTMSEEWKGWMKEHPESAAFMPDKDSQSPAELQENVNAMVAARSKAKVEKSGLWNVVESQDYAAPSRDGAPIPIRRYRPKAAHDKTLPAFIYMHGGGFIIGDLDSDEPMCVAWAHDLSMAVVSINYRHTPQVNGLTPWRDAIDAFEWIMRNASALGIDPAKVTIGGNSAGGALAASVMVHDVRKAKDAASAPRLRGQILAIPSLVRKFPYHLFADREKTSPVQCAESWLLSKDMLDYMFDLLYTNNDDSLDNPTWNTLLTENEVLQHMPRTALLVNGGDVLRDEGLMYATRLREAGVKIKVHIFDGMPHGFYVFEQLAATKRWDEVFRESIRWAGVNEGDWFIEVSPQPL